MEGKSLIFKVLGDVDVVPFCMYPRKSTDELIQAINNSAGYFRAINLEDIKAPQCFEVEKGLKKMKNIPIFHDDQHGTAIVVLGGLITAMKLAGKKF
jgi:malate dehydrogenase (oxaloacetate-decarboxylating)